ncbi:biopolymer transporter ExbD [Brevundimonas sp.]|uniref:biopolymer transporter ExbD n=1 Tax=Brevundimonas sp. TaxID=1871086 RepID=UPI001D28DEA8|nr:biopolymer transporter ExbD [Brevundimonas sp.]MBL0946801.1 biopolymer transporter ExbD [Brevundimonas sp.]
MGAKLSGPNGGKTISQNADINVTPFVDIMLVLLIIFMVAAPLATVSIRLDLPPATPPVPGQEVVEPVVINIQQSGQIFIGVGDVLTETDISRLPVDACAALGGGRCQEERVFIRADAEVMYNDFMTVMNTLQMNGFLKVGLMNEDIM